MFPINQASVDGGEGAEWARKPATGTSWKLFSRNKNKNWLTSLKGRYLSDKYDSGRKRTKGSRNCTVWFIFTLAFFWPFPSLSRTFTCNMSYPTPLLCRVFIEYKMAVFYSPSSDVWVCFPSSQGNREYIFLVITLHTLQLVT